MSQVDDGRNDSNVILDNDLPSEITFEKKSVPKQRTQSVQSVLSSVSLKSLANPMSQSMKRQHSQPFIPPQHSLPQFINAKAHIQAPAIAASSKRRASFEIGQRLPFLEETSSDNINADSNTADNNDNGVKEDVETDGETDINDSQRQLTDDALRKLSHFSKFTPAEVDLTITKKKSSPEIRRIQQQQQIQHPSPSNIINHSTSTPSLARRPSSNPSSASQIRVDNPKLLASTTSTQHLPNLSQISLQQAASDQQHKLSLQREHQSQREQHKQQKQNQQNLQTLNDPKRPMYIPAVLRQSHTNLKPEDLQLINNSKLQKYRNNNNNILSDAATSLKSQTSHWRLNFQFDTNNKFPTRAHWRRDISRDSCAFCNKSFTFFERKHHCRRCGDIFCAEHTSHLLKLGLDAQFTIGGDGVLCKVCDNCCKDYEIFVKSKFGQVNNNSVTRKSLGNDGKNKERSNVDNSNVGAVPADWSWSSF